jgi:hypothetical protein
MRIAAIQPTRATVELSLAGLGLLMNALWQDLGRGPADRSRPPC